MKTILASFYLSLAVMGLVIALTGCTMIYSPVTGRPIMRTAADVRGMKLRATPAGIVELSGDFDHSTPIRAQGEAMEGKINAAAAAIAATALAP
jgi:hypothetical protein